MWAFDAALEHCASIVRIYEQVFRAEHPMLGLQLYTLGNLQHERAQVTDAATQAKAEPEASCFKLCGSLPERLSSSSRQKTSSVTVIIQSQVQAEIP